jgi:hypothetical protein
MSGLRQALRAVALGWVCACAVSAAIAREHAGAATVELAGVDASADARYVAQWIAESRDNKSLPYVIVDKKDARVFVFGPHGRMLGAAPALLGLARGDRATPGIGKLAPSRIPSADRTTPAGRFDTEPGVNLDGDDVIWMDYEAGLAMHRVRADAAQETRVRRLAAKASDAHRVSAGCVVLPVSFYDSVVKPALAKSRGVVYVLPEDRPVREVFAQRASDM